MIKIILVDDHPIVHIGLKQILSDIDDIKIVDEVSSGSQLMNKIHKDFDVIILDISLPDTSGLDLLSRIKSIKPNIPVLVLSMYPENQYAIRTIQLGASGYLTKEKFPDEIISAIRKVSQGEIYVTPALASTMASYLNKYRQKLPHETLSDREYEVMSLIAAGDTLKDISEKLSISIKTVSTHRTHILKKLQVENNVEIARYALEHGIII